MRDTGNAAGEMEALARSSFTDFLAGRSISRILQLFCRYRRTPRYCPTITAEEQRERKARMKEGTNTRLNRPQPKILDQAKAIIFPKHRYTSEELFGDRKRSSFRYFRHQ